MIENEQDYLELYTKPQGGIPESDLSDEVKNGFVSYNKQTPNKEQQIQACENIGAVPKGEIPTDYDQVYAILQNGKMYRYNVGGPGGIATKSGYNCLFQSGNWTTAIKLVDATLVPIGYARENFTTKQEHADLKSYVDTNLTVTDEELAIMAGL